MTSALTRAKRETAPDRRRGTDRRPPFDASWTVFAHPLRPVVAEDQVARREHPDRLALADLDGRVAIAIVLGRRRTRRSTARRRSTVDAPPVASVPAPPRIDSRIAEPKREKKWLLTWPPMPA